MKRGRLHVDVNACDNFNRSGLGQFHFQSVSSLYQKVNSFLFKNQGLVRLNPFFIVLQSESLIRSSRLSNGLPTYGFAGRQPGLSLDALKAG
jgi:hypothetical protein